jgi:hypothetical protein
MQVNVFDLPNYELDQPQLEWLWLFSLVVAGKNAEFANKKLNAYLYDSARLFLPFEKGSKVTPLRIVNEDMQEGSLKMRLMHAKTGNYAKLDRAFSYSAIYLRGRLGEVGIKDLELCPGCGPKTSRFFYMMTREGARHAALDTHVLKFLRDVGHENVPKTTPAAGPTYERLERAFLAECTARRREPAEFDMEVWKFYREGHIFREERVWHD